MSGALGLAVVFVLALSLWVLIMHFEGKTPTSQWEQPRKWQPSDSEAAVLRPAHMVRCPECGYFVPEGSTDTINGWCDECLSEPTPEEWAAYYALLDEERFGPQEDHR